MNIIFDGDEWDYEFERMMAPVYRWGTVVQYIHDQRFTPRCDTIDANYNAVAINSQARAVWFL